MTNQPKTIIVPKEPTEGMYLAGKKALEEARSLGIKSEAAWCYSAMIEAASNAKD